MSCIVSKEPKVAPKPRNRFMGGQYELARIYVPAHVAEYIMGKQEELRSGGAYGVYQELAIRRTRRNGFGANGGLEYYLAVERELTDIVNAA